ncbi:MAG TPA: branched-chain amino acid ABC transporter substrate-binding protein [Candidatus Dormibacteraeota bacterium]|nr:branched-chain amino acid ABC transporter substrate-binding protein [Candidatus Dormibacteraeota bacterium]
MASLGLAACGGGGGNGSGSTATAKPDKVQIAAEGPFTGDEASIGAGALQAIKLAVKDFNNKGGVHGTPVTLLPWDDQHSAQTAQTLQAQGISDPTVLGIVGPMNSGVVLGSVQGLQSASPPLPFVSESASNVKVTDSGNCVAHRVNARDDAQGPADGKFLIDQGAKKIEVMDAKSDYSTALADATQKYLSDHNIPFQRDAAKAGQTDFSTIIQKIKSFGADWVYFADEGPETAPFVTQLKQAGLTIGQNINFLGTDGEEDPSIISKSQGAYDGAYATNITADPAGVTSAASYVTEFKNEYGADSISKAGPFYGSAYEATQVLLQAINNSPVKNGKISRNDVISHLASDTFSTIFGSVKFDAKGDVQGGGIYVYQAKGSDMVVVKQVSG